MFKRRLSAGTGACEAHASPGKHNANPDPDPDPDPDPNPNTNLQFRAQEEA